MKLLVVIFSSSFIFLVLLSSVLWAQREAEKQRETPQRVIATSQITDEQVAQRARERDYPGGSDEEDLQVQKPLVEPLRKLTPQKIHEEVREERLKNKESSSSNSQE